MQLVDDLLARYVEWREEAQVVADAYRRWSAACHAEEAVCFSCYIAALDQEQAAAAGYARAVSDLRPWLRRIDG